MGTYGELGRYQLDITIYCRIIKYWFKIIDTDNLIIKRLYHKMLEDCEKGLNNWAKQVKFILDIHMYLVSRVFDQINRISIAKHSL